MDDNDETILTACKKMSLYVQPVWKSTESDEEIEYALTTQAVSRANAVAAFSYKKNYLTKLTRLNKKKQISIKLKNKIFKYK